MRYVRKIIWQQIFKKLHVPLDCFASFRFRFKEMDWNCIWHCNNCVCLLVCWLFLLFYLYPPVTRKQRWRYIEFAACSKPPSSNNHRKAPYPRTQHRVRWGMEFNLHHAIIRSHGHTMPTSYKDFFIYLKNLWNWTHFQQQYWCILSFFASCDFYGETWYTIRTAGHFS